MENSFDMEQWKLFPENSTITIKDIVFVFSRVHATLHSALSVGRSVCLSVGHILLFLLILFSNVIFSHSKSF